MEKGMEKGTKDNDGTDTYVKIKQEPKDGGDIKDFAETTMNELLGWYGYEKVVDHQDTENLDLHRFTSSPPGSGASSPRPGPQDRAQRADTDSPGNRSIESLAKSTSSAGGQSDLAASHRNLVSALTTAGTESASTDHEGSVVTGEREAIVCQWCQKQGVKLFTLKTADGAKGFCSELCFTLCRRASFKKNKLCDWCKHVRHTVSFVDFQDGDQQLQFCSDKCLNQYKMNIFCKETQVHLQQIQSQVDARKLPVAVSSQRILITPDLWEDGGPNEENPKANSSDKPLDLDTKQKESSRSPEVHVVKTVHSSPRHSTVRDRSPAKKEDTTQRIRTAELASSSTSTTKSAQMFEKSYTSERERLRRLKSRDSTSSTPISLAASSDSSLLSPPRSSANSENATHFQSSYNSRPTANLTTTTGPPVGSGLSSFSHGAPPILYHPMLAASLGSSLPGLGPPGSIPQFVLPTAQQNNQGSSSATTKVSSCSENVKAGLASQPSAEQNHPSAPPLLPPPPHLLNSLWSSLAGGVPSYNPYSPYPGSYLSAHPNQLSAMMPPNTLMVPYPFIVPLPVPIPIPIPIPIKGSVIPPINIKPEPLTTTTKVTSPQVHEAPLISRPKQEQKSASTKPEHKTAFHEKRNKCESSRESGVKNNEQMCENRPAGKIACACCQQTSTTENIRSVSRSSSDCGSVTASHSDSASLYKPESHLARIPNGNPILVTPDADLQNDVIDLSKDSLKHPPSLSSPLSDVDHNRNSMPPSASPLSNENDAIISFNPLALVPVAADPRNSARRSLILDAPSVARDKNRSPSPGEKRVYYGNSPREGIYGKRRCIRSRVKTK